MKNTSFTCTSRPWGRIACMAGLTAVLGCAGAFAPFVQAAAAAPSTEAELAAITAQVRDAASQHSEAVASAAELDRQISEQAAQIVQIEQEVIPAQRAAAAEATASLYKMRESAGSIISMLVSSSSFSDFITQMKYFSVIQDENVRAVNELERTRDDLNARLAELSAAKDEAVAQEQRASDALDQVSAAQQALEERAQSEDAEEAAAARAAADEAAAVQQQMQQEAASAGQNSSSAGESTGAAQQDQAQTDTSTSGGFASTEESGSTAQTPASPQAPSEPEVSAPEDTSSDDSGWLTGVASYYGLGDGLMGGTTASGDTVTETSMGIAMLNVPLGTMVEIRYNGKSVVAVVNDRGPYAHGRVIDMQPAVARALGFISVGVGTVEYRFL